MHKKTQPIRKELAWGMSIGKVCLSMWLVHFSGSASGQVAGAPLGPRLTVGSCQVEIEPLRSIEIVHPNIVNDTRSSSAEGGPWSFRTLIERMAPVGQTDRFLRGIFESWESDQAVNGETLSARPAVVPVILNQFLHDGSDPRRFQLANAPFRLIAIANRLDLRNATTAGEGRFVFALTSGPGGTGFDMSMTMILEYKLPLQGIFDTPQKWAEAWHELDAIDPVTDPETFKAKLQRITDAFSSSGAFPGKPNGSAISQIRSNEVVLNGPWQLREFNMNAQGFMVPATTKNSPLQRLSGSQALQDFVNATPALNDSQSTAFMNIEMPDRFAGEAFLGGKADQGNNWSLPNGEDKFGSVRVDNFGLLTCNGCHNDNKPSGDIAFYHISPTNSPGVDGSGRLSLFMTRGEPIKGGRRPAELTRRAQDMGQLLCAGNKGFQRTVVFMLAKTQKGQNVFFRGGLDHDAAKQLLGKSCSRDNFACAIPIRHRNLKNATSRSWKAGDNFLDWYGQELFQTGTFQGLSAQGSPADWTTDLWRHGAPVRTVATDGFGQEPLNQFGDHDWMLDVDMDCSKAFLDPRDGVTRWFEVKGLVTPGIGLEGPIHQDDRPYPSTNHFAKCGKITQFEISQSTVRYFEF